MNLSGTLFIWLALGSLTVMTSIGAYGLIGVHTGLALLIGVLALVTVGLMLMVRRTMDQGGQRLMDSLQIAFDAILRGDVPPTLRADGALADAATRMNQVVQRLTETLDEVRAMTRGVRDTSYSLTATSQEASQSAMQVAQTVEQLARGAGEQTEGVTRAASEPEIMARAAEQVSDNARSTADTSALASKAAQDGRGALEHVVSKMGNLRATVSDSASTVSRLGQLSQEIGQIVDLIRGVAGQTNLLALNAAIEAARAGEHGRGFAVVAEEVRKLAVESANSTEKIQTMIEEIQSETLRAVKAMERGTSEVEEGVTLINKAGDAFTGIVRSIEMTDRQVAQISGAAEALSAGIQRLVEGMNGIAAVAEESAAGAQEVAASAQQQTSSMGEIIAAARDMSGAADKMMALLGQQYGLESKPAAGRIESKALAHL
ncbi:MAG: methyl-accepting chemotaxis protein [Candidatus Sericytochromatia bacterium]|nr:methyl-accepting chemotaxis protein [Candidatus Sericytochromatia bacterium]